MLTTTPNEAAVKRLARLDHESQTWIDQLSPDSPQRDAAIVTLHAHLLKAARYEVGRRRASYPHLRGDDFDDLAQQSADDALVSVLRKLGDFRGDSRFTTWAYKFALFEARTKIRRRAWQGRECRSSPRVGRSSPQAGATPQDAETAELLLALQDAMRTQLSAHQREVLVAVTLNDVPIDVLAERLNTTRGALYKTVHDARHKLRRALVARGLGAAADTERIS